MTGAADIVLHAGALRLVFNPGEGSIRYLCVDGREILRGIGAPVRDRAWATIPPVLSDSTIRQHSDAFTVEFTVRCKNAEIDFRWRGKIAGTPHHGLTFDFDGEALADFEYNRIGFCVLHPAELQGAPCAVEHVDGTVDAGRFPEWISARQPFTDIRAITHHPAPDCRVEVRLEGEAFEMEDQRNWTDASFKTYCTPLRAKLPLRISRGTRIRQRVTVRVQEASRIPAPKTAAPWETPREASLVVGDALAHRLPPLGAVWNEPAISPAVRASLRKLHLSHLRVDLWLQDHRYPMLLRSAAAAAAELGTALEIALFGGKDFAAGLEKLCREVAALTPAPRIARWLVFDEALPVTPPEMVAIARPLLRRSGLLAPIGGGAPHNFCELNCDPAIAAAADFTVHAVNPQVHAFDEASIVETLALHGLTARNAARLAGGRPAAISAVTLTRRWRMAEAGARPGLPANLQPLQVDARHAGSFNAAWTLGSLAQVARQPLQSATYFDVAGANGLFAEAGAAHPVAAVFAHLAPFAQGRVFATTSSHPLHVEALALGNGFNRRLLVANLRATKVTVRVSGNWGERAALLDPHSVTPFDFA